MEKNTKNKLGPILIIGGLFFIFGFITWLNGILIPYLKISCELTDFQALFVAFSFYISYTIMALPSAWVLGKTGLKKGMMIGLWLMAFGALFFIPAAYSRSYILFLTGLFIMGTGLALLQTSANPYVTILGPRESAARRISIMGICNKLAGGIAPLVLAYFILNDGDTQILAAGNLSETARIAFLDELALRVINPYIIMAILLFLLGIGLRLSPLPEIEAEEDVDESENIGLKTKSSIFAYPQIILGAIALFFYVGAEVIAGDTIIRYGISLGIDISLAKAFTTYTMLSMIAGYLIWIILTPKYISQQNALKISAIAGIIFTVFIVYTSGIVSVIFVALLGMANAIVWPAIWPLALHNLGKFIKQGSALLIMAVSGGALLPLVWGKLSDSFSAQQAYWVLAPFYLIILFYSVKGYKLRSWR
jgi:MFS transporter, FHS family, L-fucose permease